MGVFAFEAYVLAFESTHAAMAAASALDAGLVPYALIPTPRAISAGCGMALRFDPEVLPGVEGALGTLIEEGRSLYRMTGSDCQRV